MLFLAVLGLSCEKSLSAEEQLAKDVQLIEQYLTDRGLSAQKTSSGLHYIITKEGSGGHPSSTATVTVQYKGYFLDGTVFDQTTGSQTAKFALSGVITGWQECIPLLQKGGSGQFFIPSGLGYGNRNYQGIPANSVLIFDITLINF